METVNCNLCGQSGHNIFIKYETKLTDETQEFNIVRCGNCNLLYTNPRPARDEINKYYHSDYSPYHDTHNVKPNLKDRIALSLALKYPLIPDFFVSNNLTNILNKIIGQKIKNRIRRKYHNVPVWKNNGICLDIGCGTGGYLNLLKEIGWTTYGVEINKEIADALQKKHNMFCGPFEETNYKTNFFDSIRISHTLEHVYDPYKTLTEIHKIIKKDGILLIEVPNTDSINAEIFNKYWTMWDAPRHLHHFNLTNLKLYLQKTNFKLISTFTICNLYQMKLNMEIILSKGIKDIGSLNLSELKLDQKTAFKAEENGKGDNLIVVCGKMNGSEPEPITI